MCILGNAGIPQRHLGRGPQPRPFMSGRSSSTRSCLIAGVIRPRSLRLERRRSSPSTDHVPQVRLASPLIRASLARFGDDMQQPAPPGGDDRRLCFCERKLGSFCNQLWVRFRRPTPGPPTVFLDDSVPAVFKKQRKQHRLGAAGGSERPILGNPHTASTTSSDAAVGSLRTDAARTNPISSRKINQGNAPAMRSARVSGAAARGCGARRSCR
jgi:hypothetical protein